VQGGELLLTTGYGWPESDAESRRTIRALNDKRLAAVLFEPTSFLGRIPASVHRNTMRGRLQRVQSLLSGPLDDPSLRRDLAVIKEIEHLLASEARPAVHHA
jgi:hypothetical protein